MGRIVLALFIAKIALDSLADILLICSVHFSFSSICILKNFTVLSRLIVWLDNIKTLFVFVSVIVEFVNNKWFVFETFRDSLLALHQSDNIWRSEFTW